MSARTGKRVAIVTGGNRGIGLLLDESGAVLELEVQRFRDCMETNVYGPLVNVVDPGWVRTDMGGPGAPRSVAQGADTIVWCATLPKGGLSGRFFHDRKDIAW